MAQKITVHVSEKRQIAEYAARLIGQGEYIYLDAGTTTGYMLEFLRDKDVTVVTNAVVHAQQLAKSGVKVRLVGKVPRKRLSEVRQWRRLESIILPRDSLVPMV